LKQALQILDAGGRQICLIVNELNHLLGVMTDGDFRRLLLGGTGLDQPVLPYVNSAFISVQVDTPKERIRSIFKEFKVHQIPVLESTGTVVGLVTIDDFFELKPRENQVIILAGGRGTRLGTITHSVPKPMVEIGGRPILESVIDRLRNFGFKRITLCVGYLSEQIHDYFGNGSSFDVEIDYVDEDEPRGTAGPLAYLGVKPDQPFIVMNADLVTELDIGQVLDSHVNSSTDLTIVTRPYEVNIPFGVVLEENGNISKVHEKPSYTFDVSSGVYALSPSLLNMVPAGTKFDMPDLIRLCIDSGLKVKSFSFSDYWIDIGRMDELERARREWQEPRLP
jgi:dTDP-glucose pyrophosphorylase